MIVTSSAERRSNRLATKIGGSGVIYRPSLGLNSSSSLLLPKICSSDDSYERHSGRSANDWQSSRESVEPLLSCLLLVRVRRQLRFLTHDPTGRTLERYGTSLEHITEPPFQSDHGAGLRSQRCRFNSRSRSAGRTPWSL